ncbi:MAG: BACON domain-containing protein, partial [Planctomycetota bacterium]
MSSGHPEQGSNRVLNRVLVVGLGLLAGGHATPAAADFVEWQFDGYPIEVEGETYSVVDVYAAFDAPTDTLLNVFNSSITTSTGIEFHHDDFNTLGGLAGAWNGVQSDEIPGVIDARIDSFVLIGGEIGSGNSTVLDPSFDPGTGGTVASNAGWFNSNPPNLQGRVDPATLRTRVARFVIESTIDPTTLIFSANLGYNQGLGTPAQFAYDNGQGSGPTIATAFDYVCDIVSLDPASTASSSQGGGSSFLVSIADQQCDWLAETDADWIALDVGAGTGDGAVEFTVAENPAAVVRSGEILVNGVSHTVEQDAAPCAVTLVDPPAADFPPEGGAGAFTAATNGPDCSWNAFSSASWVAITGGGSGTGESGEISYTVAANPTAFKRTAVVVVGTVAHSIVQAPAPCAVTSLDVETASFDATGGEGTVTVSTNGAVCSWSATSSAPWLAISAGGSGTGSQGEIVYVVAPNPVAAARTGEIAVDGLVLAVEQAAAPCSVLSISAGSSEIGFEGGPGSFEVTTNGCSCEWCATSSADWIVLDAGSGSGVVSTLSFTVAANEVAEGRSGEISVGGFVHTVVQDPAPCVVTAAIPSEVAAVPGEASYSVAITTNGATCEWSATTSDEWITLDVAAGTGDSGIEFTVAANPVTAERVGSIEIGDVMVTVTQAALPCAIVSLDPTEANPDFLGGPLSVSVETNGDNCDWEATSDVAWIEIVEGGTGTGMSGTIAVEIAIYDGVESRFGTLTVGSQSVAIAQSGGPDCNANGLGDEFEVFEGLVPDCNDNGVPDSCDIADGTSEDLNNNGIPDECEQDLVVLVPGDYPT